MFFLLVQRNGLLNFGGRIPAALEIEVATNTINIIMTSGIITIRNKTSLIGRHLCNTTAPHNIQSCAN